MESTPTDRRRRHDAASAERLATHAARLVADSHCHDVRVIDVRGRSSICDYLVIATGTSDRQIFSVAEELDRLAVAEGQPRPHTSDGGAQWVVIDFIDVMVHLFDAHTRAYYDLESLWADGSRVDWQSVTAPGQFAKLTARSAAAAQ